MAFVRCERAKAEIRFEVGRGLHAMRLLRRVTTHELERRTGIQRGLIRYYEAGRVGISLHTLRRLAAALECEVTDFLGDRGGKAKARDARGRETARIKGQKGGRAPPRVS